MGVGLSLDQLHNWAENQADKTTQACFQQIKTEKGLLPVATPLTAAGITNVHGVSQDEATHVVNALSDAQGITSKEVCKNARKTFLSFIKRECGLPDTASIKDLPQTVQTAMKCTGFGGLYHRLADWGENSSHPLTARRILDVTTAIKEFQKNTFALENCPFFGENSFEGLTFMKNWRVMDKEPFGVHTSNMKLYLNLFKSEDYKAVGAALNIFGTKCRPNMLYDIKLHLKEINAALEQGPLDGVKLFQILRPGEEVPGALTEAVAAKDIHGISSALISALDCDLESWTEQKNTLSPGTPDYEKRHLASQLLGKFPYFTKLSDLQAAMDRCFGDSKEDKLQVSHQMANGLGEFGLGNNSGVKTAKDAVNELFRSYKDTNAKMYMTFVDSSGHTTSSVAFVGKHGVDGNVASVNLFAQNVKNGLGGDSDYMFGMVMASFMQQGISTFRQLGQVECGFLPQVRPDALRYQVTQNRDGSMTIEMRSHPGRVDEHLDRKTGKSDFYDVDIFCKYTLYKNGSQKVDPDSHWHMTLNPTAGAASTGTPPGGFQNVDLVNQNSVEAS